MIPFSDMVTRWQQFSSVPLRVGSTPEGELPPYATLNVVQSNPTNLSSGVTLWTESLIQLSVTTNTLEESESRAGDAINVFNKQNFGKVTDMILLNRTTGYSEQPNLTGNRTWTATLEFRIRH